ncbi:Thiol-disulfide isomerase or thioredoxin [Singulisphaera sp. GP187]|uniref:TlpA family protein disulfide reductase n=1 Tax=Singulisphaera sp. GP187 TaxID=1882752 RepID=UPI00092CD9A2|nr:TlpA disulfide reductase family protein [Singulisphaera sp. GP187]SIO58856.1 Thiol-disulfide isomerase or thioredoxin [Singulisphaera sp. GP187]
MQHALMTVLLVSLTLTTAPAQTPKSAQPAADFEAMKKEYDDAEMAFREVMGKEFAKSTAEGKRFYIPFEKTPPARFAARFLEFAEKNPGDPLAFDALERAVNGSFEDPTTRARTIQRLRSSYVTDPKIKRVIVQLVISPDEESEKFVYEIIARNPDREVRIMAYKTLIRHTEEAIQRAERIQADESVRKDLEAHEGKSYVERSLARGERGKKDLEGYRKIALELFGDRVPDLSIGKPAPELTSQTLDGKEVKLSDYRGKVVVLDIWATWCGPCREMIPHERGMVARLKDKPFALVSISVDEQKETLTEFLATEKMPWTHWWNGSEGKIIEALDVTHYPTIFVLDAKGIIRAKELRGESLEETVNKLLDEIEVKAAE